MDRRDAYFTLCSHYRRWLAHSVRINTEFIGKKTDEELAAIPPKVWRTVANELTRAANQADEECMAVWHIPEDKLSEFVQYRTHPELETLMHEQYGLVWSKQFMNWVEE